MLLMDVNGKLLKLEWRESYEGSGGGAPYRLSSETSSYPMVVACSNKR